MQDSGSLASYRAAWRAVMQLLRDGHSFSGYERNCVFLNGRGSRFANISAVTGLDFPDDGRAVAVTDWDGDGDLDVWLYNRTGPRLRLMQNQTITANNPTRRGYVAVRLQGTSSNRDAIGARVELLIAKSSNDSSDSTAPRRTIQTLTAGDAFLSQSTKWLHFGVPEDAVDDGSLAIELVVRWPAGTTERFTGLRSGQRYRLVEGSGKSEPMPAVERSFTPKPSNQPNVARSTRQRAYLSNRLPLPVLRYRTADRTDAELKVTQRRPLLVVIWASWCNPCVEELSELAAQYSRLQNEGVDVLALSVDGLDATQSTDGSDAKEMAGRLQLPFPIGTATREMLDKWQLAESVLFNRTTALSVPSSFLVDGDNEIAVIYRGRVEVAQLVTDCRQLDVPLADRRQLAVPLAGRWTNPPRQLLASAVGRLFEQNGYDEDYVRYLQIDTDRIDHLRAAAQSEQQRAEVDQQYASAHFNLGLALLSAGDKENAKSHFRRAVLAQTDHVEALINLGAMLAQQGDFPEAIPFLKQAVRADANSVPARMNLAAALGSAGELGAALEHYRHVVQIAPATRRVQSRLARTLLERGQAGEAVDHLVLAIKEDAGDFPSTLSLAWLRATNPDEAVRNGRQAIQLANRLNTATGGRDPRVLDVLAAAFAETGDFETARETVKSALRGLGPRHSQLQASLKSRLHRYEQRQPYRDVDGRYP